jgi:hypothetical protein
MCSCNTFGIAATASSLTKTQWCNQYGILPLPSNGGSRPIKPIAPGVALAQPERGVIAPEGGGSILMSLGCLATCAGGEDRR